MGSLSRTSEIAEVTEEPAAFQHSKENSAMGRSAKEGKHTIFRLGSKDSLEDDINQLFESFRMKSSSRVSSPFHPEGTSPMWKNSLKKPITVGVPRSPGFGNSDSASLKQALRDLSLSKASEMAAIKRSSKPMDASRISEAGRIKHLYNVKIVEVGPPGPTSSKGKESMVEITLVPEECGLNYSEKTRELQQQEKDSLKNNYESLTEKQAGSTTAKAEKVIEEQNDRRCITAPPNVTSSDNAAKNSPVHGKKTSKQRAWSPKSADPTLPNDVASSQNLDATISKVHNGGTEVLKGVLSQEDKTMPGMGSLQLVSEEGSDIEEGNGDATVPVKEKSKRSPLKQGHKGRVQGRKSSSGLGNSKRVGRVVKNAPCMVKPVIKSKSIVKKKVKQSFPPTSSISKMEINVNNDSGLGMSHLICQRCQCSLQNANKQSNKQVSQASHSENSSHEVRMNNVKSSASILGTPPNNPNSGKTAVDYVKNNSKLRDKGEFSQSSKSSLGDFSSSTTSLSDESNPSRSSCSNRPHMSKDVGWEAIRQVRRQQGSLGLRHFNLLKKLGCGDIGTVYLAELISTSCLFAIKVMDNEFLARRKKMLRAQTEREILRILDHPFLPTLFAQFTSDNLSCLVMEYCPGGDLHVLRQKQPGRHFLEPAARFYVAEVLLALEYLHMLGIIYRDLKPENILVKDDGHIMLTDFDLSLRCLVNPTLLHSASSTYEPAKVSGPCTQSSCMQPFCTEPSCRVPCFSPKLLPPAAKGGKSKSDPAITARALPQLVAEPTDARSNSFVGTHEYLAPEIIKGEGHGAAVDWWTFGIFLYELLYGRTPFKGAGNEETLSNVVLQSLRFPESPILSSQAQDLIRGLLVKDPEGRLGSGKGAAEIKQHPFFEGLNWALIRCMVPPELPECHDFGLKYTGSQDVKSKFMGCNATGEHLEFDLF